MGFNAEPDDAEVGALQVMTMICNAHASVGLIYRTVTSICASIQSSGISRR